MRDVPPAVRVTVDLAALARNYSALCHRAAPAEVGGVVKADAYGLGIEAVAARLTAVGCRSFFVSTYGEALQLRGLQPLARIFVLDGLPRGCAAAFVGQRLIPVLNTLSEVREWAAAAPGVAAALQFDSGMTRAGMPAEEVAVLAADGALQNRLDIGLILSHLACADEPDHAMNAAQLERFSRLRAAWPGVPWSLANSAGIFLGHDYHGQMVRPGIALYGGRPAAVGPNPMAEVVRVQARVMQIRTLADEATVGYGASYRAHAACRIATIGIGYADGYLRSLGNRAQVSCHGRRAPVIGRVSMDLVTIDVSGPEHDALAVGDYVDVIGGAISIEAVANWAGTLHYELLTNLSVRAQRIYSAHI